MSHLTDLTLNAYLDSDLDPGAHREADAHLAACPECAARLASMRSLFVEIEALPELALSRDLSHSVVTALQPQRAPVVKPTLSPVARLAFAIQAVGALIALAIAVPIALQFTATLDLTSTFQPLTFDFQSHVASLQAFTLDLQSLTVSPNLQLPTLEIATLILSAIAVTLLWFVGNGLLLRLNSPNSLNPRLK